MRLFAASVAILAAPVAGASSASTPTEKSYTCKNLKDLYNKAACMGKKEDKIGMDDKKTKFQPRPVPKTKKLALSTNVCKDRKGAVETAFGGALSNFDCIQSGIIKAFGQAGGDVTNGYVGGHNYTMEPWNRTLFEAGMCPVNVHWHLGAEHKSDGQYDDVSAGTGGTVKSTRPTVGTGDQNLYENGVRRGFRCSKASGESITSDDKFTKEYDWQHCVGMKVGETYEVHWPHSALGHCGSPHQYQSPFYDGVLCNPGNADVTNAIATGALANAVGVQAQVFTIVNDEDYYYPDLMKGMIVSGTTHGHSMTYYTGSTTGTSRDNSRCSAYAQITWQVDRKCHQISASSFDKMCADMKLQADDMSSDLHAHGARELVDHKLTAGNQQNVGSARQLGSASSNTTTSSSSSDVCPVDYSGSTEKRKKVAAKVAFTMPIPSNATGDDLIKNTDLTNLVCKSISEAVGEGVNTNDCNITSIDVGPPARRELAAGAGTGSASKKVTIDYTLTLPPGMSDAKVDAITAKISNGGAGAADFTTALKARMNANIAASTSLSGFGAVTSVESVGQAGAPPAAGGAATSSAFKSSFSVGAVVAATLLSGFDMRLSALALLAFGTPVVDAGDAPVVDTCGYMQGLFRDNKCCESGKDNEATGSQFVAEPKASIKGLAANPCADAKAATLPTFNNIACALRNLAAGPQAGTDVSSGYVGGMSHSSTPLNTTLFSNGLCPVNVHWHLGAEHKSTGEYDDVSAGTGTTAADPLPATDSNKARFKSARRGFRCPKPTGKSGQETPDTSEKWTKKYKWQHCIGMEVGETYEVHWPHSKAGACGTVDQYQSPFYDGVFCHHVSGQYPLTLTAEVLPTQVGVQAQVFTIVNDEDYYYPDLMRGMIVDGKFGEKMTYYTGSTTGTSRDNTVCSAYTPITWQVDRTCHQISASTFDKMCADMKMQRDDMSSDLHAHGAREVVSDSLAANNHINHGRALADRHLDKP